MKRARPRPGAGSSASSVLRAVSLGHGTVFHHTPVGRTPDRKARAVYDRYAPATLSILAQAGQEARLVGAPHTDVPHLLLGAFHVCPTHPLIQQLTDHGITIVNLRHQITQVGWSTFGSGAATPQPLPLTRAATAVFDHLAPCVALAGGSRYVLPEHVLGALATDETVRGLLAGFGVRPESLDSGQNLPAEIVATVETLDRIVSAAPEASAVTLRTLAEAWASLARAEKIPDASVRAVHDTLAARARDLSVVRDVCPDDVLHIAQTLEALRAGLAAVS
jgi:hypothetical protein